MLYTYIMEFMCLLSPNFIWSSSVKTRTGPKFLSEIKNTGLKLKGWTFAFLSSFLGFEWENNNSEEQTG